MTDFIEYKNIPSQSVVDPLHFMTFKDVIIHCLVSLPVSRYPSLHSKVQFDRYDRSQDPPLILPSVGIDRVSHFLTIENTRKDCRKVCVDYCKGRLTI